MEIETVSTLVCVVGKSKGMIKIMRDMELQSKISDLEKQIAEMPAGSIAKKTVKGKVYFYHRWTEDKKRREKY